ncbi:MAG: sugar phosphate isomerase/epimerase family protein, partial [Bryobacterales bacterium]|nr:sugar phosphate isomerase/epimerase family protein [Bryobacterales bacterium]
MSLSRRTFLAGAGTVATLGAAQGAAVKIGVELGCISSAKYTPYQYLDYVAGIGAQVAQFSANTLGVSLANPDQDVIRKVRDHATKLGITTPAISAGSICPSSSGFNSKLGTAEEQIAQGLKLARMMGATAMRAVVGGAKERPQIEMHMQNMSRVLKGMRSQIRDSGVKIALETHGGDFQARELKALVEDAGSDILGICLDSGNPLWMLEDPHLTLELLGPYTINSHVRDTAVWRVPEGVAVRWVNMGEGNVDIDGWIGKLLTMQPGVPVTFENIVSAQPRVIRVFDGASYRDFPKMPASELARFLALAERGKPVPAPTAPPGKSRSQQQLDDLEVCVRYTKK